MCADKHKSFYKLALLFFMEVTRHVQSMENKKLVILLKSLKKSGIAAFVFYCDPKHSDVLWGPVMFVVTCFEKLFIPPIL